MRVSAPCEYASPFFGMMRYFIDGRTYAHWPDASGHTAWEKLDELGLHSLCHDRKRDRDMFLAPM